MSSCVVQRSPVTGQKRAYGYSWEEEVKLGAQSDKQIQQQYGLYNDEALQNYVDEVAQDVLATSHMRGEGTEEKYKNTEFYFRVLDSPVINAFALPGGYVYVTRGLLGHLRNEAQLAVVLGHEIGHVAARHASQRAFEQQVGQLALIGGAVGGELMGLPGGDILQMGSQAAQLMFLKYGRDDERESDQLGVEYAAKQHYMASEGADFFTTLRRMSEQSGQSIPTWQSTHPDPSARANTIPQLAEEWRQKGYEQNVTDRDQFMRAIDDIVFGMNPRQGFTENGIFYHPDLAFQFPHPEGWQVVNQASAVQMVNEEQNAIIVFQIDSKNDSPQASVKEFLNQEGITSTGGSGTSSNGLNAYRATANAESQDGSKVQFYLYSAEYNGNIYRFVCYTLADQFDSYQNQFAETTGKFRELNDSDILNIRPAKLRVYQADRSGTLQSFLPDNLPLDITAEDVAIANQMELSDRVEAGTWIKIPRQ
ncbi:M48 family metalloprotease [Aliifodinibius sp. 1BSP15-2V2]|uniref:M48 family metalloprotease n=1 Tax=Fodinibius salsisoli TaxID=2820877 RepID=A0ABT3PLI4_9BACT|nr:M48 family metalloprotease [Fodinibius salsisoli]